MTRGLTLRLVLAMSGVALASALLASLLLAPLLSSAAEDAVREPLGRQADFFSRLPGIAEASGQLGMVASQAGVSIGGVSGDGERTGVATALDDGDVERLAQGREVSTEVTYDGTDLLVEARPTRDGGAIVLATDAVVVDDASSAVRRRVLLAIGIGLTAALLVAWLLASRLARPLTRTAAAARRMAAGERGVDLPTSSTNEVADVATALAGLDAALITSEGRQREFLLSVSHELRTPLTAVRGYAEALADGLVGPEETTDVARTMIAETERLERYVADLLALARLQADDFAVQVAPADVVEVLTAAATSWGPRGEQAGVSVSVEATVPLWVETDASRLRQILDGLLDNAVRVCGPGDRVVLVAAAAPDGVRIEVRDSGPGLTDDDAAVAFRPGVLHERYAGLRPGGHGLGLAIVHRLVVRLGGTISLVRAPEGGAAFVITLH